MRAVDLSLSDEHLDVVMHAARLALVLQAGLQAHRARRARWQRQPERQGVLTKLLQ